MTERPPAAGGRDRLGKSLATATDLAELEQRASEARQSTVELVSRYLESHDRTAVKFLRSRDADAAREEGRRALSESVSRYASLLRALGEPPERTLVIIKSAFNEAVPQQDEHNRAALEEVVKWTIKAYFAA